VTVETPAGKYRYREVSDSSEATWPRWKRGLAILREIADRREKERPGE
jgi:hypothetical protein